jgi:hypothetical protein
LWRGNFTNVIRYFPTQVGSSVLSYIWIFYLQSLVAVTDLYRFPQGRCIALLYLLSSSRCSSHLAFNQM